jgi:DNA-binding IclR family transcriptional regulator
VKGTSRNGAYPGAQAVTRALALLKAFTAERNVLRLPELAQQVGLNKTTAHRLLSALAGEGLLERLPAGAGYRLGPELLALGSRALSASGLREACHGELQALALATRETVTLEVLVGRDVLILDEAVGDHVVGSMPSRGTRWPAHATSTGKVLLAHLPPAALEALLDGPLPASSPRTITAPGELRRELGRVRSRGWATASEELEIGFVAIGAPVRAADGEVVAAISVGGPKARLTAARTRELLAALQPAARSVSARLGYRAPGTAAPSAAAGEPAGTTVADDARRTLRGSSRAAGRRRPRPPAAPSSSAETKRARPTARPPNAERRR